MKVFYFEFKSGNFCFVHAESEEAAWHYLDKDMQECYEIAKFEEIGDEDTYASVVYVNKLGDKCPSPKYNKSLTTYFIYGNKQKSKPAEVNADTDKEFDIE